MADAIVVLNAGSSSLKFSVFRDAESPGLLLRGQLEAFLLGHGLTKTARGLGQQIAMSQTGGGRRLGGRLCERW